MMLDELTSALTRFSTGSNLKRPDWTHVILWTVGIIIFICLTLKDVGPLVQDYETNNVAPQMRIVDGNKTIKPPALTFCMPRSPASLRRIADKLQKWNESEPLECEECEKLANRSWDVWKDITMFAGCNCPDDYHKQLSGTLSKKLMTEGVRDDFSVLDPGNLEWNLPILDAAWDMLNCIAVLDAYSEEMIFVQNLSQCFGDHDLNLALSDKSISKLFERVTDVLCQFVQFRYSPYTCRENFNSMQAVAHLNLLCMDMPMLENGSWLYFSSVNQRGVTWPALGQTNNPFHVLEDENLLTWPLQEGDTVFISDSTHNVMESEERALLKYDIILTVADKRESSSCYKDSSATVCKGNCMVTTIIDDCRCVPFTFRRIFKTWLEDKNMTDLPYCSSSMYDHCKFNESHAHRECEKGCQNPCEYIAYHWHATRLIVPSRLKRRVFTAFITPVISPFVEFTTSRKHSPEQFFSQLAAVFNLYLGVSGLSVIALVVCCLELFKKWRNSRRNEWTVRNSINDHNGMDMHRLDRENLNIVASGNFLNVDALREIEKLRKELKDVAAINLEMKSQLHSLKENVIDMRK